MKDNHAVIVFKILKWCIKSVLVIFGIIPLARCGSGYQKKNGKVTFNGNEIANENFVVLSDVFGKDDAAAYYKRYGISGADPTTFTALDKHYAKDKATVFFCDEEREGRNYYLTKHSVIVRVKDALPASFSTMGENYTGYAKDDQRCYFQGVGFKVKDAATLSLIGGRFVKDQYQVYYEQAPLKGADVTSFRLLNEFYAKDTAHAYYFGYHSEAYNGIHEIPCRVASFVVLDYPYSKDAHAVFYLYVKIGEADPATFSIVGNGFSKDKSRVYAKTKVLPGADPATFRIVPHDETSLDDFDYTMDKAHVFWKEKTLAVADVGTFKALGLGYATDDHHVFYHAVIVKNADPRTFRVYDHGYGDTDAEDATGKYLAGLKIKAQ